MVRTAPSNPTQPASTLALEPPAATPRSRPSKRAVTPCTKPRKRANKSKTANLNNVTVNNEPNLAGQNDTIPDQDASPEDESYHLPQGFPDVPVLHMETLARISVLVDDHGAVNLEALRSFDTATNQRTEELRIPDAFREVLGNEDDANAAGLYTLAGADNANVEHLEEDDQAQSYFEISDHTENIDPGAEQTLEVAARKDIDEGVRQILRAEATMTSLPADTFDHKSQYKGWFELLMSSSSADESLRADINKFIGGLDERDFPQSLVDIEAFTADNTRKSWHTHCPHMDEDWHRLIEKIHKILPELRENEFTKPSGKNMARMATSMLVLKTVFNDYQANLNHIAGAKGSRGSCQMNYPSKNSMHLVNCHVVDPTNPSFNLQRGKMQESPRQISTRDTIPIRNEACRSAECHWARRFGEENWRQLEELLVNFSYEHIKLSPINIILGETNFRTFLPKLRGDPSIISEQVYLNFGQKNLWRQKPSFTVVWDKASMKISNLIFYAFHPSRFFYSHPIFTGIYNDLIWNAFFELSGLGSWDVSYFVRISAQQHDHGMIRDHLVRLFAYRAREKKTGQIFPAETIEMLFPCFLKLAPKEIQKAKKNNTSILHEIVTVIAAKGRASQEAAGNVHRRNSLAVRRASGFKELERGRATQSAAGWPSLKRGGDTHRAAGYPGLKNGRATKSAMAQDIRNAKFEALRRSVHYRKILKADKIRKAQFQEHSTSYKGVLTKQFLQRQAYWYDRDKCPNGLRYDGDGGPELDSETWDAYYDQKSIPAIVPMRVNNKQLKTEKYLEEFRAREATAMVSTRATATQTTRTAMATSQITKATVTAVTAPRTYHAMPDEDGFRDISEVLLEDDLIGNELDLTGDPPINPPIDPRLLSLPSASSNDPSNNAPTDTPALSKKRGRGPNKKPRMTAKRKREPAEAAAGAAERGEDAADIVSASSGATRPAEAPKPKRARKQVPKR